ncbi:hypothetical protein F7725_027753 [Dissostichus mawsoni]|uniref:Uncharacterized protein n=1 Tax=Dissostichus mawsoni TaxID=36200 RepID=A0A7J5XDS4_DISMA|nr:hypothetical protein F7725_027753 [Dissostichus mawsoni]
MLNTSPLSHVVALCSAQLPDERRNLRGREKEANPPPQARPAASRRGNVGERLSDTRINPSALHHTA